MKLRGRQSGFTIVELLIVIVVIAILAAITIVAYNGIQTRARNSQIISGVNAYRKAIELYAVDAGAYPSVTGCLGADYPSNACWTGINGNRSVNATLDSLLDPYIKQKPTLTTKLLKITTAPDYRLGATYNYASPTDIKLIYYLEGAGQPCLGGSTGTTELEGTQCAIKFSNP
jgi:prepilin-type N-terminal cleavage/methylation domain-containing protein